jgi:hypothetical protein
MAASSLNLLRYFYGGGERAPRRATKEVLCSLLQRISSPSRRYSCSTRVGTAAAKEQSCLRSSDLVALEYADLNLPNKAPEVTLCSSFFLLSLLLLLPTLVFSVFDKICFGGFAGVGSCQNTATCQPSQFLFLCM